MQVELSKNTLEKVNKASRLLGIKKQELIDKAISLYLNNLKKTAALKKEIKEWDSLSDEALINFEKS